MKCPLVPTHSNQEPPWRKWCIPYSDYQYIDFNLGWLPTDLWAFLIADPFTVYPPCGPREVDRADIFPEQKEGSKGSIISDSFMPCSVYVCRHTIMECLMYVQTVLRIRIFWPSDPFILSIRNRIRIFNIIIICFSCEISYSWAITWKITLIFSPVEGIFPFFSVDFSQSYFFPLTPI